MKNLILCFFLCSCVSERAEHLVGSTVNYHAWKCVKRDTDLGMSFSGNLVITDTCSVSKCFYYTKQLGKNFLRDKIIEEVLVEDKFCI